MIFFHFIDVRQESEKSGQITGKLAEDTRAKLLQKSQETLQKGLSNLHDVSLILEIAKNLKTNERNELAIKAGIFAEERVEAARKDIQVRTFPENSEKNRGN